MAIAIVTGSSGLIGSETVKFLHEKGLDVIGIDNNLRQYFFGKDGSTIWNKEKLVSSLPRFKSYDVDIRNKQEIDEIFEKYGKDISLIVHSAAQPSHDWAAKEPITDFFVNAVGTLNLLEATRISCPEAVFIFISTNKVYGDTPNLLPLIETETRFELSESHKWNRFGITEEMSIDQSTHSLFGVSKCSADLLVQEYGRYFGMKTGVFRGGCLTGPSHSGAELHGFLAYLIKCTVLEKPYTVFGYKGKQVRDNIHSHDLVSAFWEFFKKPMTASVFNIGGSRHSHCSMLEAISMVQNRSGKKLDYTVSDKARTGDHIWYVSDVRKFQNAYPEWKYKYGIQEIINEMVDAAQEKQKIGQLSL